ncbi:MAG: antibiotic biosynthesis monooxygenase family protein, partial [Paracoccaceae bacterium]
MIAIIFEVIPAAGRKQDYLDIAASMRPMVEEIEGFISVERFQSMSNPDKLLSISFFEDQA